MDFKESLSALPGFIHPGTKTGTKYQKYYIPWMGNYMAKSLMVQDNKESVESCWARTACR